MSKTPKILPATTFRFCPYGYKLFRTLLWTDLLQLLWNLADHCAQTMLGFSLYENIPQSSASSTQQAAINSEAKNTKKIVKEF